MVLLAVIWFSSALVQVPLHRPSQRQDGPPRRFDDAAARDAAVVERVAALCAAGRPVLIGTDGVSESEALSARLTQAGIARCTVGSGAACELFADGSGVLARPIGLTLLSPVPEPGSALLLAGGVAALAWRWRRAAARTQATP